MEVSEFTSFLEPDNGDLDQFTDANRVKERRLVPVKRLDQILSEAAGRRIFVKCDTQGFDLQVIAGMTGILPQVQALQLELPIRAIYKGVPHYCDTLKDLEKMGFIPAGFFLVSRALKLDGIEFDCLFVRA